MKNLLQKLKCFLGWHKFKRVEHKEFKVYLNSELEKLNFEDINLATHYYTIPAYSYFKCEACGRVGE